MTLRNSSARGDPAWFYRQHTCSRSFILNTQTKTFSFNILNHSYFFHSILHICIAGIFHIVSFFSSVNLWQLMIFLVVLPSSAAREICRPRLSAHISVLFKILGEMYVVIPNTCSTNDDVPKAVAKILNSGRWREVSHPQEIRGWSWQYIT